MRPAASLVLAAAAVAAALPAAAAAQGTPPFPGTVVTSTTVGDSPGPLIFAFGGAWTVNLGDGSVSRVDARTGNDSTAPIGPNVRDITSGFGRVWALRTLGNQALVTRLGPGSR